ncbi:TRAP transporter small permease subunit [Halomonas sp. PAMB 3264]|uniref:TRAP transporter small permease n=1 Tax=Halomonas sp. PAMB 3264 TaxID=3075222 RepID=UPI00289F9925|nr:TRAP transporter small permease subunit [Halomonas sp. PAMB 3264]WNL41863.1 TRAP transporter small permease subunit [Halomonas sp. PAMB 3264]
MDETLPPAGGVDRFAFGVLRLVTRVCDALGVAILVGILGLVVTAVLARDFLNWGMPWSEEVVSLMAIYAVGLGSISAWVRSDHLVVDLFSHRLNGLGRQVQYRFIALVSLGFFALAGWGAWVMAKASAYNNTVSLGISFTYLYYALLLSFACMAVIALWQVLRGPVSWRIETAHEEHAP